MSTIIGDVFNTASFSVGAFTLASIMSLVPTLLIAVVALLVIRAVTRILERVLDKSKLDKQMRKYTLLALRVGMYTIAVLIVMDRLGIPVTSLVALLSVCSLGLTLAAEDILGNLAGGLVILSSHPFAIGDVIETSGTCGAVEEITLNHTKLLTPDGLTVLLPNKALSSSQLINYTALGRRRVTQKITASYDAPTEAVKNACYEALSNTPLVLDDPGASVFLTNYGESSIEYTVFCWCKASDYIAVSLTLGEQLRPAFAKYNVEMTYDHLNVHIVQK